MAEIIKRQRHIVSLIKSFNDFGGLLFSLKLLIYKEFSELFDVQFRHKEFIIITEFLVVVFLKDLFKLFATVKYFPQSLEFSKKYSLHSFLTKNIFYHLFHAWIQINFHHTDQTFKFLPTYFSILIEISLYKGF